MDNFPWAETLLGLALTGYGLFQLSSGFVLCRGYGGICTRLEHPFDYWFEVCFIFAAALTCFAVGLKNYLSYRKLLRDDEQP